MDRVHNYIVTYHYINGLSGYQVIVYSWQLCPQCLVNICLVEWNHFLDPFFKMLEKMIRERMFGLVFFWFSAKVISTILAGKLIRNLQEQEK